MTEERGVLKISKSYVFYVIAKPRIRCLFWGSLPEELTSSRSCPLVSALSTCVNSLDTPMKEVWSLSLFYRGETESWRS